CSKAKEAGLTISCDLNYRKKLWSTTKAQEVMSEMMEYVDIVVANEEDAEKVFGIKAASSDVDRGVLNHEGYRSVACQLLERFGLKYVAITMRESFSASDNGWSCLLYDGQKYYQSRYYNIRVVDRVGGGDAFAAGLIYGLANQWSPQDSVEFAAAASCLKHTVPGDFNMVSVEEVKNLAGGEGSGRVQR
ncbi:MAG TPA: PfkB family carbohydrate kinase, partial [Candidatus Limnocylindrales bacterium]|nr:PfkB family carbohydrate kinase [Candidatus Limnocylindrales bacterium]